jgi:glycosyltransferase 2 family protein
LNPGIKTVLQYTIGLGIGGVLLFLTFRNINISEAWEQLSNADFRFVYASLGVSLFSHFLRAVRWKMLLEPAGFVTSTYNTFAAVMVGYMANNAVPRLGEVSRCSMLLKSDKVPFSHSIGSVVLERIIDMLVMMGFIALCFLLEYERLMQIVEETTGTQDGSKTGIGYYLLVLLPFLILGIFVVRKYLAKLEEIALFAKIITFIKSAWLSAIGIFRLRHPGRFLLLTLAIWFCYILQYYVCFFALSETSQLSFYFAMMVMVIGGIGIILPVPGGVGAFHFFCQLTFITFGYSEQSGAGYALLIHTSQYLMLIAAGALAYFSLILLPGRDAAISSLPKEEVNR